MGAGACRCIAQAEMMTMVGSKGSFCIIGSERASLTPSEAAPASCSECFSPPTIRAASCVQPRSSREQREATSAALRATGFRGPPAALRQFPLLLHPLQRLGLKDRTHRPEEGLLIKRQQPAITSQVSCCTASHLAAAPEGGVSVDEHVCMRVCDTNHAVLAVRRTARAFERAAKTRSPPMAALCTRALLAGHARHRAANTRLLLSYYTSAVATMIA